MGVPATSEVHEAIIRASTFDDVGSGPKIPSMGFNEVT